MRPALPIALAALTAACGGAPSRAPSGLTSGLHSAPPTSAPHAGEAWAPDPAAVIGWALGGDRRAPRPPTGDAYLLLAAVGKPPSAGTAVSSRCVETASFLPAPPGDPRIFFVVKGGLQVQPAPGQAPRPLQGSDPALAISRLLAWRAAASPLEVLVEARPHSADAAEIWVIAVDDRAIVRQGRAPADRALADQGSFFMAYSSPRCLSGDGQESYLEVEPTRGKAPTTLEALGELAVRDVAWAAKDGQSLYLLVDCPR
jgi:hypothetical protein